jgi:hypothetical protein
MFCIVLSQSSLHEEHTLIEVSAAREKYTRNETKTISK